MKEKIKLKIHAFIDYFVNYFEFISYNSENLVVIKRQKSKINNTNLSYKKIKTALVTVNYNGVIDLGNGKLVEDSLCWRNWGYLHPPPLDLISKNDISGVQLVPFDFRRLHFYAGVWHNHFGHFITETLSNLLNVWQYLEQSDCNYRTKQEIVVWFKHANGKKSDPINLEFVQNVMHELNKNFKIYFLDGDKLLSEIIIVKPSVRLNKYFYSYTRNSYIKFANISLRGKIGPVAKKIYISRRKLNLNQRLVLGEFYLEASLIKIGFRVVYPEDLTFLEQMLLFRSAEYVVAPVGSALHNLLFSQNIKKVFYIGTETWAENNTFGLIDDLLEGESYNVFCQKVKSFKKKSNASNNFFPKSHTKKFVEYLKSLELGV